MLKLMWMPSIICRKVILSHRTMATSSIQSSQLRYLDRPGGNQISYRRSEGTRSPGVVFLPGFMSNMNGGKALALEAFCKQHGHSYVRFDYQGCGESRGPLSTASKRAFDIWKTDAQAVLDQLTTGPQVLVGSSMGGAIMILLALDNPSRIQALLGVATAVAFDKPLTYTESQQTELDNAASENTSYVMPQDFLDKQYQRCLLGESVAITQPVCLIHGMQDDTVPYGTSVDLAARLQSGHVDVILKKSGKHRMSEPEDLKLLIQCLENLLALNLDSNL